MNKLLIAFILMLLLVSVGLCVRQVSIRRCYDSVGGVAESIYLHVNATGRWPDSLASIGITNPLTLRQVPITYDQRNHQLDSECEHKGLSICRHIDDMLGTSLQHVYGHGTDLNDGYRIWKQERNRTTGRTVPPEAVASGVP